AGRARSTSVRTRRCSTSRNRARRGRRRRTSRRRPRNPSVVSCGGVNAAAAARLTERGGRMAAKKQQTHAKRARELAVKERRERKRAKKAERAIAAEGASANGGDSEAFP